MSLIRFYSVLALRDTLRLKGPLAADLMIVVGICLPLLLLQGLVHGLVRQHEQNLEQSPSAGSISIWATRDSARPLDEATEAELERGHPGVRLVIREVKKVLDIQTPEGAVARAVTLLGTKVGDPSLALQGGSAPEDGIVLARTVATGLGIRFEVIDDGKFRVLPGQQVVIRVVRDEGNRQQGRVELPLTVSGVVEAGEARLAHVLCPTLEMIDDYQQGHAVPGRNWPAAPGSRVVGHEGFLLLVKEPLSDQDRNRLHLRGLQVEQLDPTRPEHRERCTLGGLLRSAPPAVYTVTSGQRSQRLILSAEEIEGMTEADDVALPWNEPMQAELYGQPIRVVGVSVRKRWLKGFWNKGVEAFSVRESAPVIQVREPIHEGQEKVVVLSGQRIPVQIQSLAAGPGNLGIVPAEFLAQLRALQRGEMIVDRARGLLVPVAVRQPRYQARVYARTIHDVPAVDAFLRERGYVTQSERVRVLEVQGYARTLRLLVAVVGGTVALFGTVTLAMVLTNQTARKRRSIGVLRTLGMSRWAVLYLLLVRAGLIGILAGTVVLPIGLGLAALLTNQGAYCDVRPDVAVTSFGLAVVICLVGAIAPAVKITWFDDPVLALTEGQAQ